MRCDSQDCKKKVCLIGTCKSCEKKFCSKHRLPETHNCCKIEKLKENRKEQIKEKLLSEKCVASKIN